MNFLDGFAAPENQEKLVITVAPTAPNGCRQTSRRTSRSRWESRSRRRSTATTPAPPCCTCMRELDGKGSKRLSKFNELIAGVRARVPDMIIQVGGSISFAPEATAKRPSGCRTTPATCWPNSTRNRTR
jgi:hypothetical protein